MRATVIWVGLCLGCSAIADAGELRVVQQAGLTPPVGLPIVRDILALSDRGLVVVGDGFVAPAGPGRVITEIFVTRLDASGVAMWTVAWGSPEAGPYGAVASGAALGPNGDILVSGQTFYDEPAKGFVLRINARGQMMDIIDIPAPNTNVDDVAVVGARVHVAARQLVSFDLTTTSVRHTTEITSGDTSNGDLVAKPDGNLYFAATTETGASRDFILVHVREGGIATQVTIGGSADDQLWALAVSDDQTRAYIVGRSLGIGENGAASDFPYVHPLRPFGGGADATLVAFQGTAVVTATSWGGDALDSAYDVAVAPNGSVVVVGETESTDFPIVEALRPDGSQGRAYATWFDADLGSVLHSTRLGTAMTQAQAVAFDSDGRAVIAGRDASGTTLLWVEELADGFRTLGFNDWWPGLHLTNVRVP